MNTTIFDEEYSQLLQAAFSEEGYRVSLFLYHLEEISILYEQRISYLDDPELVWTDLHELVGSKLEAHINALVIGEDLALALCKKYTQEGDFGELFGAVALFCRQNRFDLFLSVLENTDPQDEERYKAILDALCAELPLSWGVPLSEKVLDDTFAPWTPLVITVLGYHRISCDSFLETCVEKGYITPELFWTIGRLGLVSLIKKLKDPALDSSDPILHTEAARTFLRLKRSDIAKKIFQKSPDPVYELFAGGEPVDRSPLSHGIYGAYSSVPLLLSFLEDEAKGSDAALALLLISGAELYEDHFVPEEIDQDILFDEEKEKLARGEPLYPPGEEPGITVRRICQNQEKWQLWFKQNKERFSADGRYRLGKKYTLESVKESLKRPLFQLALRQILIDELAIVFDCELNLEPDMSVEKQWRMLV
ncbi:Uncharacterized protein CHISP_2893 [Chitinispirillum alkaliphilum]|nr:Uncharacterized protein CHISP_2893 [Chitinispirillum alkaliphilum]